MLQAISNQVDVIIEPWQFPVKQGNSTPTAALQYILQNTNTEAVIVHVDFRESVGIELRFGATHDHVTRSNENTLDIYVTLQPMERRMAVFVVNTGGTRAFVKVDYSVQVAPTVLPERWETARDRLNALLHESFLSTKLECNNTEPMLQTLLSPPLASPAAIIPLQELRRRCIEVYRYFKRSENLTVSIDRQFPPNNTSLWGTAQKSIWTTSFAASTITWRHLNEEHFLDESWSVYGKDVIRSTPIKWSCAIPGQETVACALHALITADNSRSWLQRLFGSDPTFERSVLAPISLCIQGRVWTSFVVDLLVPALSIGHGVGGVWNSTGAIYPMIVQKAFAKRYGSYAAITTISTRTILQELTGCPILSISNNENQILELLNRPEYSKHRRKRINMVSFAIDHHHIAFKLGTTVDDPESNEPLVVVHDTLRLLEQMVGLQITETNQSDSESSIKIPWTTFLALDPRIFSVRMDLGYETRRRHFMHRSASTRPQRLFGFSLSVLSTVVVRCYLVASQISDQQIEQTMFIHRVMDVNDQSTWTTVSECSNIVNENEGECSGCRYLITSLPALSSGEYVVTISAISGRDVVEQVDCGQYLSRASPMEETLLWLFRCLDRDIDGLLTREEVLTFLRTIEALAPMDDNHLDKFMHRFATGRVDYDVKFEHALTIEDLREVYATMANENLQEIVWRDLCTVLGVEKKEDSDEFATAQIYQNDIIEVDCVISTDQEEVDVVILP